MPGAGTARNDGRASPRAASNHKTSVHRLVELLLVLQVRGGYVPVSKLRETIPDYAPLADKAFHQRLAADLGHLRAAGMRIDEFNAAFKPWNEGRDNGTPKVLLAVGELNMPRFTLEPDEVVALYLAVRSWGHTPSAMTSAAGRSAGLLNSAALDQAPADDADRDPAITTSLGIPVASLAAIAEAVQNRQPVTFEYQRVGAPSPERRFVDPWGVVHEWGRHYLVGFDRSRRDPRVFRASRIQGVVRSASGSELLGLTGTFTPLPRGELAAEYVWERVPARVAVVRVQVAAAAQFVHELGEHARRITDPATSATEEAQRFQVTFWDAGWIAGILRQYAEDLVVEEPGDVLHLVEEGLAAVADQIARLETSWP